jgi:alpha-galactosidase
MYVDRTGLHPTHIGALPSPLAALNMTNVLVQGLSVEAALAGDPELLVQAVALDPLTAAGLTLKEIRDMTAEMLEAQRAWLPQYAGRKVNPVQTISIPKDVKRQPVPTDPALAIANRFGRLAEAKG